jgi:hypothetical protein
MKVLSAGWNTFSETGKYTYATVEYAGLVSYSMLKNGGMVVKVNLRKITMPVTAAIYWPFANIKDKAGVIFRSKKHEEKIRGLEEKLMEIERRLAFIERHGVVSALEGVPGKREKRLDEERRGVLQAILEANKLLRETA